MAFLPRFAPALLAIILGSGCSVARPPAPAFQPAPPIREVLRNGTTVIVQQRAAGDVVAVQLWVRAGGRDESASELGLAHYLEHMLFKGTPSRAPGFVEREIESVGGRINAGTSLDYTYYHALLPAARAAAGIEMLADVSTNATLDESMLDREKQVVLEEMRLGEDSVPRDLSRRLYAAVFDGHPYGRPVIGTPDLIRGLTRATLTAFYQHHYVPEAFTLVVVGRVDPREILAVATRSFGRTPRSDSRRLPASAPPTPRPVRIEVERPGSHAHLGLGWLAPKIDHADTPAVDLLVSILGRGRSSRLTRLLRERLGLVTSITGAYRAYEAAGIVTVNAQLDPANVERVESEIVAEVRRIQEHGVTDAEHRRAISSAESRQAFATETVEGRARAFGEAETVWRLEDELAYVDRVRSVTAEQLRAAARRYLDPERYARILTTPRRTR